MDSKLVMFAIEAGVKLGRRIDDVLATKTAERPLLLPLGDVYANFDEARAVAFFDRDENVALVEPGGPYHGLSRRKLVAAHQALVDADGRLEGPGEIRVPTAEVVAQLHGIELSKRGMSQAAAVQRVLGTVAEIGIDYFAANPEALGKDSNERKIVSAFLEGLTEVELAAAEGSTILQGVLGAALRTLGQNTALVTDDRKTAVLLGGIATALIKDLEGAGSQVSKEKRERLFERIGSSLLRGAATAFSKELDLFLPKDDTAKAMVGSTLKQFLNGIRGQENLFTNESLELLFDSSLAAVGENVELLTDKPYLEEMIRGTVSALTKGRAKDLFSEEVVATILRGALEVFAENIETMVNPQDPKQQLLASALSTMVKKLSKDQAQTLKGLLSKRQAVGLVQHVLEEVAQHPEVFLGEGNQPADERKTVLAQVVASVAAALSEDPGKLLNGQGVGELVRVSMRVVVSNADKLIDLESPNPKTNLLYKILTQMLKAASSGVDQRGLVTRDVFDDVLELALPLVSANLEVLLEDQPRAVHDTVHAVLALANGNLQNRVNGENLPVLIEGILLEVLWRELNLEESTALEQAALRILRAA